MRAPETEYVEVGGARVAYQVWGRGDDLVLGVPTWGTTVEANWNIEGWSRLLENLSGEHRIAAFDPRGSGLSDRVPLTGDVADVVADMEAVLDAVGARSAHICAADITANVALAFAVCRPDRCDSVILMSASLRLLSDDDYELGFPGEAKEQVVRHVADGWGRPESALLRVALPGDERAAERDQVARAQRQAVSPRDIENLARQLVETDGRHWAPQVKAPVLVIHSRDDRSVPIEHGRWIAEHVPNGRLVELPGDKHFLYVGDTRALQRVFEEWLGGPGRPGAGTLRAIVFTDIVGSTESAARLGADDWRRLLARHQSILRRRLDRYEGTEHSTAGDGMLASFSSASDAVAFGLHVQHDVRELGLLLRVGVHLGDIAELDGGPHGMSLHVAARVMSAAEPGSVVATTGVRDALVGADDLVWDDFGLHTLKGVPDRWPLWRVRRGG